MKKIFFIGVMLAVVYVMSFAQFASATSPYEYTVRGRITGALFEGMRVYIWAVDCGAEAPYAITETDEDGYFYIYGVETGHYYVQPQSFSYIWNGSPLRVWVFPPQEVYVPIFSELIFFSGCCK